MKLNSEKSKFIVVIITESYHFNTRLNIENEMLLGVIINEQLTWHANTDPSVKKAYTRMLLLHSLFDFGSPMTEMINVYIL